MRKLKKGQLARLRLGLSLREVANQVGISEVYLSGILSGRMKASPGTLKKLGELLHVDPAELWDEV